VKKHCTHKFIATSIKGIWTVKVRTANSRGSARDETVSTTVFKCSECGIRREYPDSWERNYIACDQEERNKLLNGKGR